MKRILPIIILLTVAGVAVCQDTVRYPYPCYMEWPKPIMGMHFDNCSDTFRTYDVDDTSLPTTRARQFTVDTPTVIYGIAVTLTNQDSFQNNMSVTLYYKGKPYHNSYFHVTPVRTVEWTNPMPFRYITFESTDYVSSSPTYGQHLEETAKAYEFYFDTPVVVMDTFFVGCQTEAIICLVSTYNTIDHSFELPIWRTIS